MNDPQQFRFAGKRHSGHFLPAGLVVLLSGGHVLAQEVAATSMQFEFEGSGKEWHYESFDPIIQRLESGSDVVFVVRAPDTCGLTVESPSYDICNRKLTLKYVVVAEGPLVMSLCEYTSRFSFKQLLADIEAVAFESVER